MSSSSSATDSTSRPLSGSHRLPSFPALKEDEVLSSQAMAEGLEQYKSPTVGVPPAAAPSPNLTPRRTNSSIFGGAGDSGVWPGASPQSGAMAFITPMTFVFIGVWYISGALTNSTSKQTLSLFAGDAKPYLSLTLMQHLAAAICGSFAIHALRLKPYKSMPADAMTGGFYRLLFVYTAGFCLTNGSFGKVNASFVDTIKAGEPIATVMLTLLCLPGERVTMLVFASLLPIVAGVAISSLSDTSFNLLGFCMAMGSNICFSARSICAKLLRTSLGKAMDNANLFVHVNLYGALALFPVVIYVEGPILFQVLAAGGKAARMFLLNGFFYYLNNQMNFLVLEKVDAVTHGLINCGRRVANIMFAIMWFGTAVTLYNGVGITLALSGAYLYMKAKQYAAKQPASPSNSNKPSPFLTRARSQGGVKQS